MKKHLQRTEYKKFIERHILRPYQDMLPGGGCKRLYFSEWRYHQIPDYIRDYPEWADCVFGRLAGIYKTIDHDFLGYSIVSSEIMAQCINHGIAILESK